MSQYTVNNKISKRYPTVRSNVAGSEES